MRSQWQSKSIIFYGRLCLFFTALVFCLQAISLQAEKSTAIFYEVGRAKDALCEWIVTTDLAEKTKKIPINKVMTFEVEAKPLLKTKVAHKIELIEFNARMPDHDHGMNTRPQLKVKDPLHWSIEGINLHMKGVWEFTFKIKVNGETKSLSFKKSLDA